MIQLVFKPEKAPVVCGEKLYTAVANQDERLFSVRARNAEEAERKVMIVFRHELAGKTIAFDAERFGAYDKTDKQGG